jgi:tetratricopeptide (TPR) repeat protein
LRVAAALNRIGIAYREWGRYPDAIRYGSQAVKAARQVHQADSKNATAARELIFALADLARSYEKAAKRPQACELAKETIRLARGIPRNEAIKPSLEKMAVLEESCSAARR